jgi:hypothetical protein
MTPDDVAAGVLSVAGVGLAAGRGAAAVLLIECSPPELDFFTRELEAHLPVRVDKVLLGDLATVVRRQARAAPWAAAVTRLPEIKTLVEEYRQKILSGEYKVCDAFVADSPECVALLAQ